MLSTKAPKPSFTDSFKDTISEVYRERGKAMSGFSIRDGIISLESTTSGLGNRGRFPNPLRERIEWRSGWKSAIRSAHHQTAVTFAADGSSVAGYRKCWRANRRSRDSSGTGLMDRHVAASESRLWYGP